MQDKDDVVDFPIDEFEIRNLPKAFAAIQKMAKQAGKPFRFEYQGVPISIESDSDLEEVMTNFQLERFSGYRENEGSEPLIVS